MCELNNLVQHFGQKKGKMCRAIDDSMYYTNVLINNALLSVNHEQEIKCNLFDEKMQKIQYKIKLLSAELTNLSTSKAAITSLRDKSVSELNGLSTQHIANNKYKIKRIIDSIKMKQIVTNLKENKLKRFKELESENQSFDTTNLIIWIQNIENGHFNCKKYQIFFQN
eukprot:UN10233